MPMRELRGNSVDASHDFEQCRAICSQTLPEDGKRIKLGVTKTKTLRSENVNVESSDRDGISGRQVWLRTRRRCRATHDREAYGRSTRAAVLSKWPGS